jgi:catechol-2,3-dioxygenase
MLAEQPIDVMLLSTDLDTAREFYRDKIGLEILIETDDFVTFGCGGDSRLVLSKSSTGPSDEATKASWRVDDLAAELEELRARGVEIEEYDGPALKTDDGIADIEFALSAWFVDPSGNTIGLLQFKDEAKR